MLESYMTVECWTLVQDYNREISIPDVLPISASEQQCVNLQRIRSEQPCKDSQVEGRGSVYNPDYFDE